MIDSNRLELLVRTHENTLYRAALAILGDVQEAEDAVQDTFLKYHSRNQEYMDEVHLKAWLLRVAINRAKDITAAFWRRNRVSWEAYMEELEFTQPEDRSLFRAVMALPEKYRLVLHLYYYEECSIREIASLLHTGEGTIKSRLSRGRTLLKTMLTEDLEP